MAIKIYIQKRPSIVVQVGAKVINTGGGAVQSVNGQTGVVVLDASDVNAYPDNNPDGYVNAAGAAAAAPVQSVNGSTGAVILTASDVGAPSGSGNSTGTNTGDQDLSGLQLKSIVVSSNITAVADGDYINVANAAYGDPTPFEGAKFRVTVRNGTATVGGTGYSTAGTVILRIFHSGSWANYVYSSGVLDNDLLPFDSTLISITGTTSAVMYKEVAIPADIGNCALRFTCFARGITHVAGNNVHQVRLGTTFAGATWIASGLLFTTGVSQIQNTIAIVGGASGKLTYPQNTNAPFDFVGGRPYIQINVDWTAGQKLYFAVIPANASNVIEVFGAGVEKV